MRKWGKRSAAVLQELDPRWHIVLERVLHEVADIALICGHRGQKEQNEAYDMGFSKVRWPHGKHNRFPSYAVDLQPSPMPTTEYKTIQALGYIAGSLVQIAKQEGLTVRWGGDWDRDGDVLDQNFDDLFHFEIVETAHEKDAGDHSSAAGDSSDSD